MEDIEICFLCLSIFFALGAARGRYLFRKTLKNTRKNDSTESKSDKPMTEAQTRFDTFWMQRNGLTERDLYEVGKRIEHLQKEKKEAEIITVAGGSIFFLILFLFYHFGFLLGLVYSLVVVVCLILVLLIYRT